MQFVALGFSVLVLVVGFIFKDINLIYAFSILMFVILSITLYCLRYLYAEGFVLHILEEYNRNN